MFPFLSYCILIVLLSFYRSVSRLDTCISTGMYLDCPCVFPSNYIRNVCLSVWLCSDVVFCICLILLWYFCTGIIYLDKYFDLPSSCRDIIFLQFVYVLILLWYMGHCFVLPLLCNNIIVISGSFFLWLNISMQLDNLGGWFFILKHRWSELLYVSKSTNVYGISIIKTSLVPCIFLEGNGTIFMEIMQYLKTCF